MGAGEFVEGFRGGIGVGKGVARRISISTLILHSASKKKKEKKKKEKKRKEMKNHCFLLFFPMRGR